MRAWFRHRDLWVLAYLAGAVALFFWPLWVLGYRIPRGPGDLWGQLYPVWSFVAEWLRRGVFPLWDFRMMGGDPILAEMQHGLFNPLNWPLFLAYPIPTWLVLLRGTFSLWLAGAGSYLYLRRSPVWNVGQAAALVGATAYMLADPFIVHLGHPQFNDGMAWLPWVLWGVDAAARRRRAIPLAAVAVALLLVSGHGQATLYTALVVGGYALWQSAEGGRQHGPQRLGRLLLVGIVGAALAAPAILPGLERLPLTERAAVPPDAQQGYEFVPAMTVDFLTPLFHGRGARGFWPAWDRVESGYAGAVALFLAALGLTGSLRQRRTWALLLLGLLTYGFALGRSGPLYPPLASLPLFSASWKTGRAIFLLSFALAIAAALGVEQLRRTSRWGVRAWAIGLLVLGGVLWFAAPAWTAALPDGGYRTTALTGLRFAALLAIGTALSGWAVSLGCRWGRAGLALLLLIELVALGALVEVTPAAAPADDPHAAALAFLRADSGWFRVDVAATARGLWPPTSLQLSGFDVPQGTGNPMELRDFNLFFWSQPNVTSPGYRLLGVKYIIVPDGAPPGGEGVWPVFLDDPLVDIHLNTGALQRVWLVYRTVTAADRGAAWAYVQGPTFRPEAEAVVEGGAPLDGQGSGRIEVLGYGPNAASFFVQVDTPALLVLSDVYYPGWEARLDGQPATIYRTDFAFRGVAVPPGEHRIDMRFRPRSLALGVALAMVGVVVMGVVWRWGDVETRGRGDAGMRRRGDAGMRRNGEAGNDEGWAEADRCGG